MRQWFTGEHSMILGAEAALVERRDVGDKIYFPEIDTEFTISGVLERTGSQDDGLFFIPLKTAQRVFQKEGKLTGAGVNVADVSQIQHVKDGIENLPDVYVVTAGQMMEQILKLIGSSKTLMFAVLLIAIVIAALGVLNTVLMSVMEKLREFGYMRCIGASPTHVFRIVLTETVTLCLVGGVAGIVVGALGSSVADTLIRGVLPYAPAGKMVTAAAPAVPPSTSDGEIAPLPQVIRKKDTHQVIHARARVARMRRVVGILLLVVVGFGAVWCVDGCVDPMTRPNAPFESSGGSACVVCVVPFTTTPQFSLPEQTGIVQAAADIPVVHLWVAPTFSIDHPPRTL